VSSRANARPTMRDVAQVAGVSLKTVSRVINGEAGVADPTAARVARAIAAIGFQRNDLAASLRHGRSSGTLGLVIEDVANPFYSVIAQAVESAARARGLMLITASAREDPHREHELVAAMLRRRVDALLIVPVGGDHRYVAQGAGRVPAVFLDRPPEQVDADRVLIENAAGARRAVEHLLEHGHERIAVVSDAPELYTTRERLAGYRAGLRAASVGDRSALVRAGNRTAVQAQVAVTELLTLPPRERPTAILTANNRNTVGALRALAGRRRRPSLVGFDDFELADVLGVTVVRSDPALLGASAARLAFGRLDGEDGPPRHLEVPAELVARGSGELAA